jgi:subtilisin-like proprotein convertase family protein
MTRNDLRTLFTTPQGEQVLLWILREHHVFSADLRTEKEISLHNWGMKFLSYIGPDNSKRSVSAFMKIAMSKEDTEDNK